MSEENVELVHAAVDAWNKGDWDTALKDAAPNFEWDNSRAMGDLRGIYGLDEVKDFWAAFAAQWESVRVEVDRLIDTADYVVMPHTLRVRGRDGIEVEARTTWLVATRDGKIERITLYQNQREALETAGLSE